MTSMAANSEIGIIISSSHGKISKNKEKNFPNPTPFSVTYFRNGIVLLNQISEMRIAATPKNAATILLRM